MNKFILTASALVALSGYAMADAGFSGGNSSQGRNYDLRDSDTYTGPYSAKKLNAAKVEAFRVVNVDNANEAAIREQHRLDEKH
jgi:hypothetical protein